MRAFLFVGQGGEYSRMAEEIYRESAYARELIDGLSLPFDFNAIYVSDSDLIHDTRYAQIGNFLVSYVLAKLLNDRGLYADVCAGLSLGEYTALCYAGAIGFSDTVAVLRHRSQLMYDALNGKNTGMTAVIFFNNLPYENIVDRFEHVWIANENSPNQVVVAGALDELERCEHLLMESGAKKCVRLDVTGAFHTPLLKDASVQLDETLQQTQFSRPTIPVYYNVIGDTCELDIRELLVSQLYRTVKFERIIRSMIRDGADEFYVIGAGKSIDGFIRSVAAAERLKLRIIHIATLKELEGLS